MNNGSKQNSRVFLLVDLSSTYGGGLLKGISTYVQEFKNWDSENRTACWLFERLSTIKP